MPLLNEPAPFIAETTGRKFTLRRPTRGRVADFAQALAMSGVRDVRDVPVDELTPLERTDGRGLLMEALIQAWIEDAPEDWRNKTAETRFAQVAQPRVVITFANVLEEEFIEVGEEVIRLDETFRKVRLAYGFQPRGVPAGA